MQVPARDELLAALDRFAELTPVAPRAELGDPEIIERLRSGRSMVSDLRRTTRPCAGAELVIVEAPLSPELALVLGRASAELDPAVALALIGEPDPAAVEAMGWFVEAHHPGVTVARRPWTEHDLAEAGRRLVEVDTAQLIVEVEGTITDALVAALRCSVPGSISLAVVPAGSAPARAGTPRLVIPAGCFPEPGWIQALLDHPGPVGCGLATASGRLIHLGAGPSGRPIGAGCTLDHPLAPVTSRRRLLAPRLVRPGDPTQGTLLGGVLALAAEPPATARPAPWREALAECPLVVAGTPTDEPPAWASNHRAVWWCEAAPGAELVEGWGEQGVTLVGPWSMGRPTLEGWVAAHQPGTVLALGDQAVEQVYPVLTTHGPDARLILVDGTSSLRVDRRCSASELDRLLANEGDSAPRSTRPAPVSVTETVSGLVSVVIPVHGQWPLTARCLETLRHTAGDRLELIVVDDASPDDTSARLAETDDVELVTSSTNRGFAASVNQGLARARGELVCVLNNDTEVIDGWLDELIAQLEVPGTVMVGPRSNAIAGRQQVPGAPRMDRIEAARQWGRDHAAERAGRGFEVPVLMGMCLLMRRETLETHGAFAESFGIGNGEDIELCERLRRAGGALRVADGAVVLHHGSATFATLGHEYFAHLRAGNRLAPSPRPLTRDRVGVVLSDGAPSAAVASVGRLVPLVDRVVVLERGALHPTEVAVGPALSLGAEVVGIDWLTQPALIGPADQLLVIEAGELLAYQDWGAVRTEIEERGAEGAAVGGPAGPTRRLMAASDDPLDWIGRRPVPTLTSVEIEPRRAP